MEGEVQIRDISINPDGTTYRILGYIMATGVPAGEFVATYATEAEASALVVGSTYAVTLDPTPL